MKTFFFFLEKYIIEFKNISLISQLLLISTIYPNHIFLKLYFLIVKTNKIILLQRRIYVQYLNYKNVIEGNVFNSRHDIIKIKILIKSKERFLN